MQNADNLLSEIIATFVLVFFSGAIFSKEVPNHGVAAGLGPYPAGCVVWATVNWVRDQSCERTSAGESRMQFCRSQGKGHPTGVTSRSLL